LDKFRSRIGIAFTISSQIIFKVGDEFVIDFFQGNIGDMVTEQKHFYRAFSRFLCPADWDRLPEFFAILEALMFATKVKLINLL
jgi:hypothetical protein